MTKILIISISNFPESGGIATFFRAHKKSLIDCGYSVKSISKIKDSDDDLIITPRLSFLFLKEIKDYFNLIRSFQPDIIHVHDPRSSLFSWLPLFVRCKRFISTHGLIFHNGSSLIKKLYFSTVMNFVLGKYTRVLSVGELDFKRLSHLRNNILFRNPIDLSRLGNEYTPKTYEGAYNYIFIGRNTKNKNIHEAVKWFKRFKRKNDTFSIITDEYKLLEADSSIFIYSNVSDNELSCFLRKSHFLLFPSDYEGFGLVVYEAMFFGIIPIINDLEVFQSVFECSLTFGKETPLNYNSNRLGELSKECRERAKGMDWNQRVHALIDIYHS